MQLRPACFFALLVLFTHVAVAATPPGSGDLPPSALGRDANDHDVRVEDMHGKVVVVTFWASWCGYCLKELPILANIQKLAGADNLQVVASAMRSGQTFIGALSAVVDDAPEPSRRELRRAVMDEQIGIPLADALGYVGWTAVCRDCSPACEQGDKRH